jgi:uncharacterized membrane protein (UPF0182 family)
MFMRTAPGVPVDRRRGLFVVAGVLLGLYLALSALATVWTDFLWFDSLGYEGVWWTRVLVRAALVVGAVSISFLVLFSNLALADRMSLRHLSAPGTEEDELLARLRDWIEPRLRSVRLLGSAVLAVMIGGGAGAWTDRLFLFLNPQTFNVADPLFGNDVGFYVFRLPLLRDLLVWGFNLVLVTSLAVAAAHYLNGALRLRGRGGTFFSGGAKVHVSALLAILALFRAGLYQIDAYRLLYSNRSTQFFGAGFTDVSARLPALRLLMAIAVLTAIALVVNIWRKGWTLPITAAAAWVLVAVGAGVIYPAVVEQLRVVPNALVRQSPYIAHNLTFTRAAYGLDRVEVRPFAADPVIETAEIEAHQVALSNVRLWDPYVLARANSPQEFREYYGLSRVDADRYMIDGEVTQVMLSIRELDESDIEDNWQVRRLNYTHGFGAVASYASRIGLDGQPQYLVSDIPPVASVPELEMDQPRIYFGELQQTSPSPVIVRNAAGEIDYPTGQDTFESSDYEGGGGVALSTIWRKIAFGLRFRDLNLVISGQIRPDSRIMMERNARDIVDRLAPFLVSDSDPYAVIVGGRVMWVIDMYTTTPNYPYATPLNQTDRRRLSRATEITSGVNYVRNSVKAVIDAYEGDVTFYVADDNDPILAAWRAAFPGLVVPAHEMPESLRSHIRYPLDLFTIQSEMYRVYHVTDPASFFQELDAWAIPNIGTVTDENLRRTEALIGDQLSIAAGQSSYVTEALTYYLLMPLDEDDLSYVALQSFSPRGRGNMSAFLLVDSDADQYGRLVDYRMLPGSTVNGVEQVAARIESDPDIAAQFTLWRNRGSRVIQGDITIVPVGESLLFLQPVFLEAEAGGLPGFERVIVVYGERIEWGGSLQGVLDVIFEGVTPSEPTDTPTEGDAAQLLQAAEAAFAEADAALRSQDLAGYQRLVDQARSLIQQALDTLSTGAEANRMAAIS